MPQGFPVLSVLGELVVDLIPDLTADAGPEGTAPRYIARPGGNALNVAVAAGRLGAPVRLLARLGSGPLATSLRRHAELSDVVLDGPPVFTIQADLTLAADVDRVVEVALARFGRVDLLVNAAGCSVWAPIVESEALLASMRRQFETNVEAPLRLAAAVATACWRDRRAENLTANRNVVNVSSIAGEQVYPGQGQSVYAASKAALNMLTRHMASEFETFGVRVNATAPNSFPDRVPTGAVVDAIVALDRGDMTGTIATLDEPAATEPVAAATHP